MKKTILIIAFVMQSILLLGHYCIYATVAYFFLGYEPQGTLVAGIILFALAFCFVPAILLSSRFDSRPVRWFYAFSVTWLGSMYFWTAASMCIWAAYDLASLFSMEVNGFYLASAIFGAASCAAVYSYINGWKIRRTHYSVRIPNLPKAWKGRTAVWASDLHLGHIRGTRFAAAATRAINSAKPDIIFIGGDLFDGVKDDYAKVAGPCADMKAPLGVYFIPGNHEEFRDPERYLNVLRSMGMNVLKDEMVEIDGLQIVGVDYHSATNGEILAYNLSRLADAARPSILLKHVPDKLGIAEKAGISLQISGHSHKAQMWPLYFLARRLFKGYEYGLKQFGAMQQLTSSGAGTWGPPYRLGTRSEIVMISFS